MEPRHHERIDEDPTRVSGALRVGDVMQREPATITESEEVSQALQRMIWSGFRHLPVLREGRLVGVVSERDLLAGRLEGESFYGHTRQTVKDVMSTPAQQTQPNADLAEAAGLMSVHQLGCLPVVDAGRVVGIVTATDVLARTAQCVVPQERSGVPTVEDVMTTSVGAVHPDDRLVDAASHMSQYGARHLPVIDGLRRVVGMLSDRDLRQAIGDPLRMPETHEERRRRGALRVSDAMTRDAQTVRPDQPLTEVVDAMLEDRHGALPVVDEEERLVGIVSYVDVLAAAGQTWEEASEPRG